MKRFYMIVTIFFLSSTVFADEKLEWDEDYYTPWGAYSTQSLVLKSGDTLIPTGKYNALGFIDEQGMLYARLQDSADRSMFSGLYGVISMYDSVIVPFIYQEIKAFSYNLAAVKKNGKWGYIDRAGNIIIPIELEECFDFRSPGLATGRKIISNKSSDIKEEYWGMLDTTGKVVFPFEYDELYINSKDTIVLSKQNGKWQFYSFRTDSYSEKYQRIIDCNKIMYKFNHKQWNYDCFKNAHLTIQDTSLKYGTIDKNFKTVIPLGKYDSLSYINKEHLLLAKKDNKYGIIDIHDNIIVPFVYSSGSMVASENFFLKKDDEYSFYDMKGKQTSPVTFDTLYEIKPDMFILPSEQFAAGFVGTKNNLAYLFNLDGEMITNSFERYKPLEARYYPWAKYKQKFKVWQNSLTGVIDEKGNIIFPPEYKNFIYTMNNQFITWDIEDNMGLIDSIGQIVIPLGNHKISKIEHGFGNDTSYYLIKDGCYEGVIDEFGDTIIPVKYQDVSNLKEFSDSNGITRKCVTVISDNRMGVIDVDGDTLVPFDSYFWKTLPLEMRMTVRNDKLGITNMAGETLFEPKYSIVMIKYNLGTSDFELYLYDNLKWKRYNKELTETALPDSFDYKEYYKNVRGTLRYTPNEFYKNRYDLNFGTHGYYGAWAMDRLFTSVEGEFPQLGDFVSFTDRHGDTVLKSRHYRYVNSDTIKRDKLGIVLGKKCGKDSYIAIDARGTELYEIYPYDNGPDFISDGLFRIIDKGLIGYADTTSKIIIYPQFECAEPFIDGKAKVSYSCEHSNDGEHIISISDSWFYIDKEGNRIE